MFEAKLFSLPASCLFRIAGIDAERYLHGRITQNVKALEIGSGARSLVLSPQGKIQGQFLIFKENKESFLLISDQIKDSEEFKKSILQFKVADQLELENLAKTHLLFSLQGKDAKIVLEKLNPSFKLTIVKNSRGKNLGFDLIVEAKDRLKFEELFKDIAQGSAEDLELLRLEAGLPCMEKELSDKISVADIPLEDLVSFNKGCYAGQEVVEMSIARGRANRRLLHAKVNGKVAENSEITLADKTPAGFITSSCYLEHLDQTIILGFAKNTLTLDVDLFLESKKLELL